MPTTAPPSRRRNDQTLFEIGRRAGSRDRADHEAIRAGIRTSNLGEEIADEGANPGHGATANRQWAATVAVRLIAEHQSSAEQFRVTLYAGMSLDPEQVILGGAVPHRWRVGGRVAPPYAHKASCSIHRFRHHACVTTFVITRDQISRRACRKAAAVHRILWRYPTHHTDRHQPLRCVPLLRKRLIRHRLVHQQWIGGRTELARHLLGVDRVGTHGDRHMPIGMSGPLADDKTE